MQANKRVRRTPRARPPPVPVKVAAAHEGTQAAQESTPADLLLAIQQQLIMVRQRLIDPARAGSLAGLAEVVASVAEAAQGLQALVPSGAVAAAGAAGNAPAAATDGAGTAGTQAQAAVLVNAATESHSGVHNSGDDDVAAWAGHAAVGDANALFHHGIDYEMVDFLPDPHA